MPDLLATFPRWFLVLLAVIGVLAVGAIGTWAGAELNAATIINQSQNERLASHEQRIDWHDRALDKVDGKLDRILERLGAK